MRLLGRLCPSAQRVTFVSSGACKKITVRTLIERRVGGFPRVSLVLLSKHSGAVCAVLSGFRGLPRGATIVINA